MTKRMLVDATHSEETRVAVVDGNRLVDFDYESQVRKQLKGSIFLAKVTRVEPSLQAAFVNFGGNRHGFLPFTEIHPDYYRIPIADREAILAEQAREMEERQRAEEAEDGEEEDDLHDEDDHEDEDDDAEVEAEAGGEADAESPVEAEAVSADPEDGEDSEAAEVEESAEGEEKKGGRGRRGRRGRGGRGRGGRDGRRQGARGRRVEVLGGDGIEGDQPVRPSFRRNYKIQEVVKRGQIMLIQVSKEERGNKGAAVSTYLSLPGRYCVLMPNSPRAGGVSRKIANFKERKRMREILNELKVPQGMSVIMRTAGTSRTKAEIKRDLDYLMKLWDNIRALTLESTAPALVHEEGNLVRRAIRDIYAPDIEDIIVAGDEGFKFAKDFMKMMIPSHVKKVKEYKDEQIPLFHRYQVESQINEIGDPVVTLPSGGYLVINPTEALVSVDVNSGRATKERHIEETALRTNLEAAEEVARQLRLRDLGGLVVIDFIDMEDRRNNRKVENKMRDALSGERARIQIGRISSFGLMELSRQRLNPSLTEAQYEKCPHCLGVGVVRTVDAAAIVALRALEEEGIRGRSEVVALHVPNAVALYLLNNKRHRLAEIESRFGFSVMVHVNEALAPSRFEVEVVKTNSGDAASDDGDEPKAKQDTPADDDNNKDRNSRGSRRRGRRGGRRRNNREDRADSGNTENQAADSEATAQQEEPAAMDDAPKADVPEKDEEKKPAKKSASRKKSVKKKAAESDKAAADDAADGEKETKKPARKKAAAKKTAAKKSETAADEKTDSKDDKAASSSAKPSNDVAPPEKKDYEVVNEPPVQKKKGWWNKLTD
ncbi:MAG: ribonuclease E/G [Rhodospirillales bacterium]|nr:ribonuclease E/G [Rhodospirillales bacterium]MCB9996298.1 ribonuclease E/G [Rhodospirillales bacterium]